MEALLNTHIIQVINVAPTATLEQMKKLFGYLGEIRQIKLYPSENYSLELCSRVCYVQYMESWSVALAQHLTNTIFIDRALVVIPIVDLVIPDESKALALIDSNSQEFFSRFNFSVKLPMVKQVSAVRGSLVVTWADLRLYEFELPPYPPASTELSKVEEIERTVCISNIPPSITAEKLLAFINKMGEVKCIRMAIDDSLPARFAFVEFTDQSSVSRVLHRSSTLFEGLPRKIVHSREVIRPRSGKFAKMAQMLGEISSQVFALHHSEEFEAISLSESILEELSPKLSPVFNENDFGVTITNPWLYVDGLPTNTEPSETEVTQTVCISNILPSVIPSELLSFVNKIGNVKRLSMDNDYSQSTRSAFVEINGQSSVYNVLQNDGALFKGLPLKISLSRFVNVKPQPKSLEAGQRELDEALRIVKAQSLLTAVTLKPSESEAVSQRDSNLKEFSPGLSSVFNESVDGVTTINPWLCVDGLPTNMEPSKTEVTQTVCISNILPSVIPSELLSFVNKIGNVKRLSMDNYLQSSRSAFVEFNDQSSVDNILQNDGALFEGLPLKISLAGRGDWTKY